MTALLSIMNMDRVTRVTSDECLSIAARITIKTKRIQTTQRDESAKKRPLEIFAFRTGSVPDGVTMDTISLQNRRQYHHVVTFCQLV